MNVIFKTLSTLTVISALILVTLKFYVPIGSDLIYYTTTNHGLLVSSFVMFGLFMQFVITVIVFSTPFMVANRTLQTQADIKIISKEFDNINNIKRVTSNRREVRKYLVNKRTTVLLKSNKILAIEE